MNVDVSHVPSPHSNKNKMLRVVWKVVYTLLFRFSPRPFHGLRVLLLKLFGASIGKGVHVYPKCKIWAPWNLEMDDFSCLSDDVDCYSVDKVYIGAHSTVSQYSYLCTASHDLNKSDLPLITSPITIQDQAWVTADVYVGPGVTIGQGAVIGARSSVFKDMPAWKICYGNPAKPVKDRIIE